MVHSLHGSHMACLHFLIEEVGVFLEYIKVRHAFLVLRHTEEDQHVPFLLQFLAHCFRCFAGSNGKGYQRRRYVDIIEGAAHGILAADGAKTQGFLHMEGSQKSCCRLAPACFICQFFEIFLQCEVSLSPVSPHGHQTGDGKKDRIDSPVERTPGGQIRVKPVGHEAGAVGFSLSHRELGCHAVGRRLLVLSAERHEHRAGADSGIEPFRQSLLGAVVQIPHGGNPGILYGRNGFGMEIPFVIGFCNMGSFDLLGAVGIQKGSGNIDNRHPSPLHHQPFRIGYIGNDCGFQVFFCCIADKLVRIFLLHHHCHPFLGFRNSQFRAVKAFIFLRHLVQVDIQSVSEFPHCHRYAAGTEIIAPLNEAGHLAPAEEALNLSFRQRIALLYFCTAGFNGFRIQFLGRTGGAAHAVTAGPSAYQNHHISRLGRQADHMVRRSCGHHRTDFHTLCNKSGMVVFLHFPCSQTDLVAIGTVPFGCFNGNLPLGELARQSLGKRRSGVAGTGDAHGLVYIGTAGERIPDAAAKTGSCAAERFDFRRMVMSFILEQKKPVLAAVYRIDFHLDGAGIHFLRSIQIIQLSFLPESLHSRRGHIHKGHRALRIFSVNMDPRLFVFPERFGNRSGKSTFLHINVGELRGERGMTAVVRPVGIQYPDFRHRGIPFFLIPEIIADHGQILMAHGKAHGRNQIIHPLVIQISKAFHHRHRLGVFDRKIQRFRRSQRSLPGFHRVHQELHNLLPVPFFKMAVERIHQSAAHPGAILSRHNGKALLSRVRPLIILPRQELHAQHQVPLRKSCLCIIHRRFGEHRSHCLLIILIREAVHIVTMVNGGIRNPIPQHLPKLASQTFLPLAEPFLLSYIQTSDIRQVQHSFP